MANLNTNPATVSTKMRINLGYENQQATNSPTIKGTAIYITKTTTMDHGVCTGMDGNCHQACGAVGAGLSSTGYCWCWAMNCLLYTRWRRSLA